MTIIIIMIVNTAGFSHLQSSAVDFTMHTQFTRHDNPEDTNTFGLSFQNKFGEAYYLVPNQSKKRIGWSKTLQYPFLMITPAERELVDLKPAVKKCC